MVSRWFAICCFWARRVSQSFHLIDSLIIVGWLTGGERGSNYRDPLNTTSLRLKTSHQLGSEVKLMGCEVQVELNLGGRWDRILVNFQFQQTLVKNYTLRCFIFSVYFNLQTVENLHEETLIWKENLFIKRLRERSLRAAAENLPNGGFEASNGLLLSQSKFWEMETVHLIFRLHHHKVGVPPSPKTNN